MLITDYLTFNSQTYPDSEAITYIDPNDQKKCISWKEFNNISNRVANFLKNRNIYNLLFFFMLH